MRCENCGSPIDRAEADRGLCTHCGAILPHVLKAAEKAEIVKRMVEGGHDVRIEGDRIEARAHASVQTPPTNQVKWVLYFSALMTLASGLAFRLYTPSSSTSPLPTSVSDDKTGSLTRSGRPHDDDEPRREITSPPGEVATSMRPNESPVAAPRGSARPARSTAESVVAAHKAQYDRCQRAELAQNPAAPRRYSVAMTVSPDGHAEWVEVLSEVGPSMKSCITAVTKELAFPKPATGSTRSLFTLSFAEKP